MLDENARAELERRIRAETSTRRDIRRARIILSCAEGGSAEEVAARVGSHRTTVERWRSRFRNKGLKGLADEPRSGHKPSFGPVARCEIISLACAPIEHEKVEEPDEPPSESAANTAEQLNFGFPVSEAESKSKSKSKRKEPKDKTIAKDGLTLRTIAQLREQAIVLGIVPNISTSTIQRILADVDLRPHKTEGWVHSPDPQFREKVTAICELYLNPQPNEVVICVDEKTGMQAIERRYPDRMPAPGRRRRREFEYARHGIQTLIAGFEVHTGEVTYEVGPTRKYPDMVSYMEKVAAKHPTGIVHIIWDNLNTHYDGLDQVWTKFNNRHGNRFKFHYTPKHASWVNQVELFFGLLERQSLRNASFASVEELHATVVKFIESWNRDRAHPFKWTYTGYPLKSGVDLKAA